MSEDLGYTCTACDYWNPCVSMWAAAHWHEVLTHTCDGCGTFNTIKSGKVIKE